MNNYFKENKRIKVGLIGFGRVGKIVSKLLLSYNSIDEILIYTKSKPIGYIEDLLHINRLGTRISLIPSIGKLKEADYIIISSSVDYSTLVQGVNLEDEWKVELKFNVNIIQDIINELCYIRGKRIIVYTNPVDVISYLIYKSIGKDNEIFGFGSNLDTIRLKNIALCGSFTIGEHGISMVPVGVSYNKVKISSIRDKLIKSIATITHYQGYTLVGPEYASVQLFNALFDYEKAILPLSIYNEDKDIFFGWPVLIEAGNISKHEIILNEAEEEMLNESIKKIKDDIMEIFV